ncbi:MAG: hypothetical protein KDD02_15505 [Phaeodactylibacter sp.]|nr:hypothetical protein [Phaeodactylibacter sp.]MCB9303163.1 hypothetical protein [Lewinellaceae bacterium]
MGSIKDCNFNPQIEKAITIENGRAIKIWDFNGKLFDSLKAEASVSFVSIGKDPALFFTGDDKGRVTAWPLNGYVPRTLIAHPKKITGLRVSEGDNGRFIISSSRKGANVLNLADSSIHFYRMRTLAFDGNPANLFTAGRHRIRYWGSNMKRVWQLCPINNFSAAPDGSYFVTSGKGRSARLRETFHSSSQKLDKLNGSITTLDISGNSQFIAAGSAKGETKIWKRDGTLIQSHSNFKRPAHTQG